MFGGCSLLKACVKKAQKNLAAAPFDVKWLSLPGEQIPIEDNSADTVLLTYTLCTITDWRSALAEMRRVLKPEGKLLFCEHGLSPDDGVQKWQARLNPMWKIIGGGCNLNRDIPKLIEEGGFKIDDLDSDYIEGPKFGAYNYWGVAG